jgi:hypothetical protein
MRNVPLICDCGNRDDGTTGAECSGGCGRKMRLDTGAVRREQRRLLARSDYLDVCLELECAQRMLEDQDVDRLEALRDIRDNVCQALIRHLPEPGGVRYDEMPARIKEVCEQRNRMRALLERVVADFHVACTRWNALTGDIEAELKPEEEV